MGKMIKKLPESELVDVKPFWYPGKPVMVIQTFGWCVIGFYVRHETPLKLLLKHANHFRAAGTDYGTIARQGPAATCEWRYEGTSLINDNHVLRYDEYGGEIPTSPLR